MFNIDEYVRYGAKGVFQVKEIIKKKNMQNKTTSYYVLCSNFDGLNTKIITPVDNNTLRAIISKKEVLQLIDAMPSVEVTWNEDKRLRENGFKEILASGQLKSLAQMIKSIHFTQQDKLKINKDISESDKQLFKNAENLLFEEISVSCEIKKDEVLDFILSKAS